MSQDNASFTFLHRIEEVELNIEDGRWQSALALVLTLPDICGGIALLAALRHRNLPVPLQFSCRRQASPVPDYHTTIHRQKQTMY